MTTVEAIDQYTAALPKGHAFTTRELLSLGTRAAIDQCLWRKVKAGEIIRWAWGVFIRAEENDNRIPTALEIATIKARAFGKIIAQHGLDAAHTLGLIDAGNATPTYLACCKTSSFLLARKIRIRVQGTVSRKLLALDQFGELVVKAFWHLGEPEASFELVQTFIHKLNPVQKKQLRAMRDKMPSWMSDRMVALWGAH